MVWSSNQPLTIGDLVTACVATTAPAAAAATDILGRIAARSENDVSTCATMTGALVLDGELDIACVAEITAQFNLVIDSHQGDVLLDSSAVTFIDASALGVIVEAANQLARTNRSIRLTDTARCVRRILQLTHLESMLPAPNRTQHPAG